MGIEYLLNERDENLEGDIGIIIKFAQNLIETIYTSVLDYKSLIDSNWHYLYCPKNEWAKFCKISIFLFNVREYINKQAERINHEGIISYYNELKASLDKEEIECSVIATTNYNTFIERITGQQVVYLNGSTEKWYDPYLNKIASIEDFADQEKHFLVPLIFTQSGTKPITSINMAIEYVSTYKEWNNSDAVVVVGFGFNPDDEHINGIFRTLIDDDHKKVIIVRPNHNISIDEVKRDIVKKLKIINKNNIQVVLVDKNRNSSEGNWLDCVKNSIKAKI